MIYDNIYIYYKKEGNYMSVEYLYTENFAEKMSMMIIDDKFVLIKKKIFNDYKADRSKFTAINVKKLGDNYPGINVLNWDTKTPENLKANSFTLWYPKFANDGKGGIQMQMSIINQFRCKDSYSLYLGVGLKGSNNIYFPFDSQNIQHAPCPSSQSKYICFMDKIDFRAIDVQFGRRIGAGVRDYNNKVTPDIIFTESQQGARNCIPDVVVDVPLVEI